MPLPGPLIPGRFLHRPNRFLTRVEIESGPVWSHLPDPGRLKELLIPGARIWLRPNKNPQRKTAFTTVLVEHDGHLVSVDSTLPNRLVEFCLQRKAIPPLRSWRLKQREFSMDGMRVDFLLEKDNRQLLLEVKSVTLVENGLAQFPDAVTSRGARHMAHLQASLNSHREAAVLFVVQREDATAFGPQWERDPVFARALVEAAKAGVKVLAYSAEVQKDHIRLLKELPVRLEPPPASGEKGT